MQAAPPATTLPSMMADLTGYSRRAVPEGPDGKFRVFGRLAVSLSEPFDDGWAQLHNAGFRSL
jgi:hypothetical protein